MEAFVINKTVPGKKIISTQQEEKPSSSGQKGSKKNKLVPWVEKYRPKCVDDIAYQEEVVAVLRKTITDGADLPNLLFYGPPGTGKTSTILAVARQLFGDMYRDRVLELNASDERGIQVVREKVKKFARLSASGRRPDGKPCPAFKIVILDEADSMTTAAQAALRRTMETETKTTRFCLICNYVSRIIEPITSRCSKFRFKPLADDILRTKLRKICELENVIYDEEAVNSILHSSEGDMRRAITTLQSVSRLKPDGAMTKEDILQISGMIPAAWIEGIVDVCRTGSYEQLEQTIKELMLEGYSAYQIILQLHDILLPMGDISDTRKSVVMEKLAVVDKRLIDGADEYLQIMDLCTVILKQISR